MSAERALPLAGIRVVEFTHMIMGPTCGLVLGDLGADVIKVEPLEGDSTRRLLGSGAGFFPLYNRNKKSIALDLKSAAGREAALKLVAGADIVAENFKPETMVKLGLDYEAVKTLNPKLIYVSHKGFLPGPYAHRTALDEVVQMMGGLAYMTGRKGDPVRAGSSVNDMASSCNRPCLKIIFCWSRSTCCNIPSRASQPSRCPAGFRPGRCTTCSR
jgi:crotonobetainyl-CoA:carnitine CoA-transferase CaiB-like acyl-CoA transferase